jgi:hypothetical protein
MLRSISYVARSAPPVQEGQVMRLCGLAISNRRSPIWNILLHYPYKYRVDVDRSTGNAFLSQAIYNDVAKGCSKLAIGDC